MDPFRHVRLSVRARVSVRGFLPIYGLRSTPNHFQTLPGHLTLVVIDKGPLDGCVVIIVLTY